MSQDYHFKMPDIGEGVVEAEISHWHIAVGDMVQEDDVIADAMTDKATVELTSPVTGTILKLGCDAGDILAIGSDLVVFSTDDDMDSPAPSPVPEPPKPSKPVNKATLKPAPFTPPTMVTKTPSKTNANAVLASPAVRKYAMDHDLDLSRIAATGKVGNITLDDVQSANAPIASNKTSARKLQITAIKITGVRRVIAERLAASKRNIPHFSYVEAIDMTNLEDLRAHLNQTRAPSAPKITLLPFFIRALVNALPQWPQCNGIYDDEAQVFHQYDAVHMGIAAQTDQGLIVPVLHNAQDKNIWQLAQDITNLAGQAKAGTIKPESLKDGTITLTSLGPLGGVVTTPVINRPQVGIIGPNKIVETPVVKNGAITIRKMMNLSSSFDHRIVDGYDAAQFIAHIKASLENPATLFMTPPPIPNTGTGPS